MPRYATGFMTVQRQATGASKFALGTPIRDIMPMRTMFENMPKGWGEVTMTEESFRAIEDYILWAQNLPRKMRKADDILARYLAITQLGYAQKESGGPRRDPSRKPHPLAWMTPVPRITYRYYFGWRIQRIRNGHFIVTNDSREAFYIEFGLHRNPYTGQQSPRRVRRPIMKRSFLKAVRFASKSAIGHRIFTEVFYPKVGEPGHRTANLRWWIQGGAATGVFTDLDAIPFGGGVGLHPYH